MNKPAVVVFVSVALWILLWLRPAWVIPVGIAAGIWLCGLLLVGAVRHRRPGWTSGVFFAVLVLTLPAWVGALVWVYENR